MEGNILKKIILIFICIIFCVSLTSCKINPLPGEEFITKAKEDYVSLTSGKVVIKNVKYGETEQTFTFMIDENDVMRYYYTAKNGEFVDAEYYDGETFVTLKSGEKTLLEKGDKGFPKYTKKKRHPNASEKMFVYQPRSIKDTDMTVSGKGTKIAHTYKPSSLKTSGSDEKIKSFVVTYSFDKQSNFIDMTETSVTQKEGVETENSYVVTITDKNAITSIENLIK